MAEEIKYMKENMLSSSVKFSDFEAQLLDRATLSGPRALSNSDRRNCRQVHCSSDLLLVLMLIDGVRESMQLKVSSLNRKLANLIMQLPAFVL